MPQATGTRISGASHRGAHDPHICGSRAPSQASTDSHADRPVGARSPRTSRSLIVMRYVGGEYPAGGERSRPALNGKVHASAACTPPFRPVHDARDQAQQLWPILAMALFTAHN